MATRQIPEAVYEYEIAKLSKAYEKAIRDILKELERIDIEGLSRANAAAALADITDRLKELDLDAEKWVKDTIPVAATDGAATTVMALAGIETLEEARKLVKFNAANRRMVEAMIADTQQDLLAVTQNVERRVRNKIRDVSGEVMRRNMAAGINGHRTNKREIVRDLRKELGSVLDTGIVDAGGRRWKPNVYVDMLVRTKMMRAHLEATTNEALDRGVMYATISSHGAKDACRQYEGKIVKLVAGAPGPYPELDQLRRSNQIFHPNCKHIVVPLRDPGRIDPDAPNTQGQLNKVENDIRALDHERGFIFDAKGNKLWEQKGNSDSVNITEAVEKGLLKDNVLTHNHPRNSSFSPDDVGILVAHRLSEMRAVSRKYDYSMKLPKGFSMTRNEMLDEYAKMDAEVRDIFTPKIQMGEMSVDEANLTHHHEIWLRMADKFGFIYSRSEINGGR